MGSGGETYKEFAGRLWELKKAGCAERLKAGDSIRTAAREGGVSIGTLSKWLRAGSLPGVDPGFRSREGIGAEARGRGKPGGPQEYPSRSKSAAAAVLLAGGTAMEAAEAAGAHPGSIVRWIAKGRLPGIDRGWLCPPAGALAKEALTGGERAHTPFEAAAAAAILAGGSVHDAAAAAGVSPATIRTWVRDGRLAGVAPDWRSPMPSRKKGHEPDPAGLAAARAVLEASGSYRQAALAAKTTEGRIYAWVKAGLLPRSQYDGSKAPGRRFMAAVPRKVEFVEFKRPG